MSDQAVIKRGWGTYFQRVKGSKVPATFADGQRVTLVYIGHTQALCEHDGRHFLVRREYLQTIGEAK